MADFFSRFIQFRYRGRFAAGSRYTEKRLSQLASDQNHTLCAPRRLTIGFVADHLYQSTCGRDPMDLSFRKKTDVVGVTGPENRTSALGAGKRLSNRRI